MRPLRCSIVISDHGRSKWIRWWHWRCRFTPSDAMSPVSSRRTFESARPNSSITSICFTSAMPPCRTRTWSGFRPSAAGTVAANQSRVAIRSENTTTRVVDAAADPDRAQLARPERRAWRPTVGDRSIASGRSASAEAVRAALVLGRVVRVVERPMLPLAAVAGADGVGWARALRRFSIVWASARCDDRAALNRVQGNRVRPRPEVGARPERGWVHTSAISASTASSSGEAGTRMAWGGRRSAHEAADLGRHVVVVLVAAHVEVGDRRLVDVLGVDDGGGVEQADQLGEAIGVAVVGGGAREQQGLGAGGQHPGQLVVERAPVDQVVALVDHHRIPADLLQVVAVAAGVLEGVDRDDRPLVERERVAVGRDLPADPLDAFGVEADERDGEPGPQLVLELLQDVAGGDDQDALAPAPADQLRQDQADLEGLAQADGVGDQEAGAEPGEGLVHGPVLVVERVEELIVRHGQPGLGHRHRGAADQGLEVEAGRAELGRRVGDEDRLLRLQRLDPVEVGEERGLGVTDQGRHADAADQQPVGRGLLHLVDQPLLVADHHLCPGGDQRSPGGEAWVSPSCSRPVLDAKACPRLDRLCSG